MRGCADLHASFAGVRRFLAPGEEEPKLGATSASKLPASALAPAGDGSPTFSASALSAASVASPTLRTPPLLFSGSSSSSASLHRAAQAARAARAGLADAAEEEGE